MMPRRAGTEERGKYPTHLYNPLSVGDGLAAE